MNGTGIYTGNPQSFCPWWTQTGPLAPNLVHDKLRETPQAPGPLSRTSHNTTQREGRALDLLSMHIPA